MNTRSQFVPRQEGMVELTEEERQGQCAFLQHHFVGADEGVRKRCARFQTSQTALDVVIKYCPHNTGGRETIVLINMYTYTHAPTHIHTHTYLYPQTQIPMYTYINTHTHYIYVYIYIYIYIYIYTYIYINIHTHTYMYTNTCTVYIYVFV